MSSKDSKVNVNQEVWDRVVKMEEERMKDPNYESCCGKDNPCSCNTFSPNMPSPEDAKNFVEDCEKLAEAFDAKIILNGKGYIAGFDPYMVHEEAGDPRVMSEAEKEAMRKAFLSSKPMIFPGKYGKVGKLPITFGSVVMELPEPKTKLQKITISMKNFIKKYKR